MRERERQVISDAVTVGKAKTCKKELKLVTWALRRRRCPVPRLLESGAIETRSSSNPGSVVPASQACAKKTDGGGHGRAPRRRPARPQGTEATACERNPPFCHFARGSRRENRFASASSKAVCLAVGKGELELYRGLEL